MTDTVCIIDTFSLIFQVFHAIPPMTSPSGQPTNALFGISRDLVTLFKDPKLTWLICAWDAPGPSERVALYPEYKANRTETPVDLVPQIGKVREVIEAFGIPVIEQVGWEADDVIATLTRQGVERGMKVRIVTSDKDARQLLGPQVHLFNLRKNTELDEAALMADWGIRPDQVVDFQSLVGDAVDNVPGVPLVGPKKAAQLLNQFGPLDAVLARASEAPGAKLKENLQTYAAQALLSRELVRLRTDLPLEFPWEHERERHVNVVRLQELFREFGFRKLIEDVRGLGGAEPVSVSVTKKPTSTKSRTKSLFDDEPDDAPSEPRPPGSEFPSSDDDPEGTRSLTVAAPTHTWNIVDTPEKFTAFVEQLGQQSRICLDLETTSLDPRRAKIVGWAFSWQAGHGFYLPVMGPPESVLLDPQAVVDTLRPILEAPELELVNQNVKYDLIVLRTVGVHPQELGVDPMVGDYLLDSGARSHNLETLLEKYLHRTGISISELIGTGKKQKSMADIKVPRVAEYATEDADCALQIADRITTELHEQNLWDLYWDLERPLIPVLAELEYNGIRVDADELAQQSIALTAELERLVIEIHEIAGHPFNIDSPLQLRTVLFDELKLPPKKRTKTGPSTDQDVLEELAALHPLPAKIIEHRQASKLKGTYVDALPLQINPETGRIHCSFNQVVAATGRLSSNDPNLQNIPIRTPAGQRVRKAFIPADVDWKLVCADYSQIELRMLAHFSQDNVLLDAFAQGIDIHTAVAASVYSVEREHVTSDMRRVAKAVNFGVIYGQSPFGLAAALGIPQDEAAKFIDDYFARYAGVTQFLEETLDECLRTGYATTIRGRRRKIDGIRPDHNRNRNLAERTAINTVIQGSAADLIKQAMINVFNRMKAEKHPGRMLLQIHDELVFEAPDDAVPSLVRLVREEMEQAMKLDVPLAVDVSAGDNWLETVEYAEA